MKWLCVVVLLVAFTTGQGISSIQNQLPGTCASINYSTTCCPPEGDCQAIDGECQCGADCHQYGDCCADVHCPAEPRTCTDVGITSCCNDETGKELCDVHSEKDNYRCSCNISCHLRNDCCSDATRIGCIPQNCTEAGKDPGCCVFSSSNVCFVKRNGEDCYCDSTCLMWEDCCDDVIPSAIEQCVNSMLARSRIQSQRGHTIESSTIRRYNENERRTRVQTQANFREAQATRVPRPRARMNRVRARPSTGYRRRPVR